ncbi:MAG: hypothetical protein P4L31_02190 [Candidatus Babeliales bacterium]|nr:hypothetical protein [Candidatus Babeliales bacterium]
MKNICLLSLLFVSVLTHDLRASSLSAPKTDMQKMDDLKALFRNERFPKGCLDGEATTIVSTIEDPMIRMEAGFLAYSVQIKSLRAESKKQQDRINALEKKCCVIQ